MNVKTSELEGAALDWATGVSIGHKVQHSNNVGGLSISEPYSKHDRCIWSPSTDWSQGGPLIEKFGLSIMSRPSRFGGISHWHAQVGPEEPENETLSTALTPLIAACRAIVAAKLGEVVDVPEELL